MLSFRPAHWLFLLPPLSLLAQPLEGLLATREVGPGVKHHRIYREAGPWAIEVVEFDYRHPALRLETVRAAGKGLELTSQMANREDRDGNRVVAAINGDFFNAQGRPLNLQIRNGEIVQGAFPRSVLAVSRAGEPIIAVTALVGEVVSQRGSHRLAGVNRERSENELIMYNHHFGNRTNTNRHGRELTLRLLTAFTVNDSVPAVVVSPPSPQGNTVIADSLYILSAHGAAATWMAHALTAGDTVKLFWQTPQIPIPLATAIGGTPRLIRDGKISIESEQENNRPDFATTRHPRSAAGFDENTHRMYFVVVDGRQAGYSVGMTLPELAAFLRELGCTQAINLDGGGSSTLVVRGEVMNRPSDVTGERPVANALLLLCSATSNIPAFLKMWPSTVEALLGDSLRFTVSLTDSFHNPIAISPDELSWRASPTIGRIDKQGHLWAATALGSGFVCVTNGQISDSARVVVHQPAALEIYPSHTSLKPGQTQRFLARIRTTTGKSLLIAGQQLRWQLQPEGGTISANGTLVAVSPGSYRVTATYQRATVALTANAEVVVEAGGKQP